MQKDLNVRPIHRALISVANKFGVVELATKLVHHGIELLSTGGTAEQLRNAGLKVRDVSDITGFPEMMGGRLKTLHPKVHGGLLARRDNGDDMIALGEHGILPIDLLVVNLYPFEKMVAHGALFNDCVEMIDIGGPAMIRAAAKNHDSVLVTVDPEDYGTLLEELDKNQGASTATFRTKMAAKAFARTGAYDAAVATWFAEQTEEFLPPWFAVGGERKALLRYGENPHQRGALYLTNDSRPGVASAVQHGGKKLSFNNLADADAAFECVSEFYAGLNLEACVIVKHGNPCGVAEAATQLLAYQRALACDGTSAFGGVVAFNSILKAETAEAITDIFTEVVIAPEAEPEALSILQKKKDLRVLITTSMPYHNQPGYIVRSVAGGLLVQTRDDKQSYGDAPHKIVTRRHPTEQEESDLHFAFNVAKHVKSNAIVYAYGGATVGIGAGQMSRVDSATIAVRKMRAVGELPLVQEPRVLRNGFVVASDAFFPFPDALRVAIRAGATACIQPGGSKRDEEVIALANEHDVAMIVTGIRHFRH